MIENSVVRGGVGKRDEKQNFQLFDGSVIVTVDEAQHVCAREMLREKARRNEIVNFSLPVCSSPMPFVTSV